MLFVIWLAVLLGAVVLYIRRIYTRFSRYGVKHLKPLPLIGNAAPILLRNKHVSTDLQELYNTFSSERFVGRFEFIKPSVILRDLELIKKVAVKDFEHFLDHQNLVDKDIDPFFGRNLFSLKGQEWKEMRSALSPAFTSSKMRGMVPLMVEVGEQMIKAHTLKIKQSGVGYIEVDTKNLTSRYANDVIATCAFGLKVDSHMEENNEFYTMGRRITNLGFRRVLFHLGYTSFPTLMKKFNVKMFKDEVVNFFRDMVLGTIKDREARNFIRPDMIHLLMEAKKGKLTYDTKGKDADAGYSTVEESDLGKSHVVRDWSDIDLVAQAVLFFIAGFETVSSAASFLLHELAWNPEIQERLYKEIKDNDDKNGGKFDYNSVQNLPYLDMCISEVLRKWPPAIAMDRLCVKDYNLGKPNAKAKQDFIVRKGESLMIPTFALHRDPAYFPDPLKFDPERFSEENRHKIQPMTYVPFGAGPRNCIGSRFALCEVKVMASQILQHFELIASEKAMEPVTLATDSFSLRILGGHWIKMKLRN